ncbi:long-chain fatty acid--CoA ligase [Natronomonas sp. LN261]|uniref:long-chain fatty acid--CoA ligase n=1 Tax=Natronomonas sp. LN261 TaxID=2750669 RepID=UPI0015EFB046|nr:long-chain fatty acid--CoA ligase [Natronomonas sp. LN261]
MSDKTSQTLRSFLWRAVNLYPDREVVSRTHEGRTRYTYKEYGERTARLANALSAYGIEKGDRVGTFCWNHHRHFETYFSVPSIGAQLHTINPLLPDTHIRHIVDEADDQLIFVDHSLAPKLAAVASGAPEFEGIEFVLMGETESDTVEGVSYEAFIAGRSSEYDWPEIEETQPAGLCYTSGTTGEPKGVEYTHRMLWSHTMATLTPQGIPIDDGDTVMPVVPMFHVNAWGFPFAATAAGAKHVYPGPSPDPEDVVRLIREEGVTITAGVPTVWLDLIDYVEDADVGLADLETIAVGGAAAPESMIRWFDDRDVEIVHAWGMTELSPIGTVSNPKYTLADADYETRLRRRTTQGLVLPGLEIRVVDDEGEEVPWDGEAFGELWIRGPWVTTEYFGRPATDEADFEGGWLKTGDIVTVDEEGYVDVVDRAEDVIKSAGEWISSIELEDAIMATDDVAEAVVVGVSHEKYQERPVAFVVPTDGADPDALSETILDRLGAEYPGWWLPDAIEYLEEIPKTTTGKFSKAVVRERYADEALIEGAAPERADHRTE